MTTRLFPAGVVGSMPRPQFLRDLLDPDVAPKDEETFAKRLNVAVDYIVAMQEAAGLDILSDGEFRRRSYIGIIADVTDGFVRERRDGRWFHTVVDSMSHERPGLAAGEASYLKRRTDREIKVCLPSPYLLGQRMWDPERSKKVYPTRESFMQALVPILKREAELVAEAGAEIIQIDDPHLCLFVDPKIRKGFKNPDREVDLCVDLINQVIGDLSGAAVAIHLCRRNKGRSGWVGEGGYGPILDGLKKLQVEQYVMEFSIPVAGDLDVLKEIPEDRQVGLGCVDCRGERVESSEEIVGRVELALEYLRPDQIFLNPDCGFAPGNAADIPIDEAYAKLCNEAKAGELLREKYG